MNIRQLTIPFLAAVVVGNAQTATLDVNGNYIVPYTDAKGQAATYTFVPRNKVVPTLTSSVSGMDNYQYQYSLSNGVNAQQSIEAIEFIGLGPGISFNQINLPFGTTPPNFAFGFNNGPAGLLIRWNSVYPSDSNSRPVTIQPGQTVGGFKIILPFLAGIVNMKVFGFVPDDQCALVECTPVLSSDGQEVEYPDLDEQIEPLTDLSADVLVPAPVISFSDGGGTVVSVKIELASWPAITQASQTFVNQASPRLDVLADALTRCNISGANAAEADLENLITAASTDDLSPLGAYVLRFDLREVLRRFQNPPYIYCQPVPPPTPAP